MTWARGNTRASRREREQVLSAWPRCYIGGPGCTIVSTQDDHVVPLSQGGSDELWNRRGACYTCHRAKSQREAAAGRARVRTQTTRRPTRPHPGLR